MGQRVHVIKKRAEYGNTEAFNWAHDKFENLLFSLACDVCKQEEYSTEFELLVGDYERAVEILKKIKEGKEKNTEIVLDDDVELEAIEETIKDLGYEDKIGSLIEIMENFYNERDKASSWIQFSAW